MTMVPAPVTAKSVKVCRNGDFNYPGRRFIVNDRQVRNFDSFLSQVTSGLRPSFGAVRRLYTPAHGHRVERLDDLKSGKVYVAGGAEKFKKAAPVRQAGRVKQIGYEMIGEQFRKSHTTEDILVRARRIPVVVSARLHRFDKTPSQIHVFRNGDELFKGVKFVLSKRDLKNWDYLMGLITEKIQLRTGAVRRLYTLDGLSVETVENGMKYVAVGSDRFKKLPYGGEGFFTSPPQRRPKLPLKRASTWKKPSRINAVSQKKEGHGEKVKLRKKGRPTAVPIEPKQLNPVADVGLFAEERASSVSSLFSSKVGKKEEDIFHASELSEEDVDDTINLPTQKTEESLVFSAVEPKADIEAAEVVEESKDTAIDKPVDMMEAKVVEEEEEENKEEDKEEEDNQVAKVEEEEEEEEEEGGGGGEVSQSEKEEVEESLSATKEEEEEEEEEEEKTEVVTKEEPGEGRRKSATSSVADGSRASSTTESGGSQAGEHKVAGEEEIEDGPRLDEKDNEDVKEVEVEDRNLSDLNEQGNPSEEESESKTEANNTVSESPLRRKSNDSIQNDNLVPGIN